MKAKRMSKAGKTWIAIIIAAVLVITITVAAKYLGDVGTYRKKVQSITFSAIDLQAVPDGVYEGECDVGFVYAKVRVTVSNQRIEDIELLEHRNDRGASAEKVIDEILDKQTVDVDVIAGATYSSQVIKKAVDNALGAM